MILSEVKPAKVAETAKQRVVTLDEFYADVEQKPLVETKSDTSSIEDESSFDSTSEED